MYLTESIAKKQLRICTRKIIIKTPITIITIIVVFDTKLEQLSLTPSPNSHACLNIYLTEKYFFKSNYIHIHKKNNKTLINIVTSHSNQNFKRYNPVQYKQTRV